MINKYLLTDEQLYYSCEKFCIYGIYKAQCWLKEGEIQEGFHLSALKYSKVWLLVFYLCPPSQLPQSSLCPKHTMSHVHSFFSNYQLNISNYHFPASTEPLPEFFSCELRLFTACFDHFSSSFVMSNLLKHQLLQCFQPYFLFPENRVRFQLYQS